MLFTKTTKPTVPSALTVIRPLKEARADTEHQLRALLDNFAGNLKDNAQLEFHKMTTVHYAAWLVLKPVGKHPARLVLETNYDGTLDEHLNELVEHSAPALDRIYDFCADYPGGAVDPNQRDKIVNYLLDGQTPTSAYFVGFPNRSVKDIRTAIWEYYEAKNLLEDLGRAGRAPEQIQTELISHFRTLPIDRRPQPFKVTQRSLKWHVAFILTAVTLVLLLPVAIGLYLKHWWIGLLLSLAPFVYVAVLLLLIRGYEIAEQLSEPPDDPTNHADDFDYINVGFQNHFCTFVTVKPGWFRWFVFRQVLLLGNFLNSQVFILSKLNHMDTVHFARWTMIDGDRQMVFLGNFDGSWNGYLNDFADQAWGVNLVWGNTLGFPPTRFLIRDGCKDLEAFEQQVLTHFVPAPVFYSAYDNVSVNNLGRYLEFHDYLARAIAP